MIKRNGVELSTGKNPKGEPGSICFTIDTGRQMHLSAGQ
jgi:hypothetical protein